MSVNATYDMLDYNATALNFTTANFSALFEEKANCPWIISNLYLPDLTSNLSETQIASLISSDPTNFKLGIDSIPLEANYTTLGALYPTKLEFVVESQLNGFDAIVKTNATITVDFTTLKTAIEAAILANQSAAADADAAAERARIAEEEAAAAALEAEIAANKTLAEQLAQKKIESNLPGVFFGAITIMEVDLVSKTKMKEANMTSIEDQGYLETASFTSPLATDPEKNEISIQFSNTLKVT